MFLYVSFSRHLSIPIEYYFNTTSNNVRFYLKKKKTFYLHIINHDISFFVFTLNFTRKLVLLLEIRA